MTVSRWFTVQKLKLAENPYLDVGGIIIIKSQRPLQGHIRPPLALEWPTETSGSYFQFYETYFWFASEN